MPDQFTETVTKSWGSRIMGSFMGVIVGLILFLAAFVVLYWNEGRADLSKVANTAIDITGVADPAYADGQLVALTGDFKSKETLSDEYLRPGKYLSIERREEMYSWIEKQDSTSKRNTGGSENTTTTYKYEKVWSRRPSDSINFKHPEGHENPDKILVRRNDFVREATVGPYSIDPIRAGLPMPTLVKLNDQNTFQKNGYVLAGDRYLFRGEGAMDSPEVGDMRISYYAVFPIKEATVFGKLDLDSGHIGGFVRTETGNGLYRVTEGDMAVGVNIMAKEHSTSIWILRLVGFLMMWFGLLLFLGPISVFLDVLPIMGSISRAGVMGITLVTSLVLALVTIIVSAIVHNAIALAVVVVVIVGGTIVFLKKKNKKLPTQDPSGKGAA